MKLGPIEITWRGRRARQSPRPPARIDNLLCQSAYRHWFAPDTATTFHVDSHGMIVGICEKAYRVDFDKMRRNDTNDLNKT